MGTYCCCISDTTDKSNETLAESRPKEGKRYQLLCLKGHEIVFYKSLKEQ